MTGVQRSIDAVVYDFGGVFMASPFAAIRRMGEDQGIEFDHAMEIVFGSYDEDNDHPWHRCERGEITIQDARHQIRELGRARGQELDLYDMMKYLSADGGVREAMVECVRRVRASGLRTAILTNNVAEARDFWRPMLPLDELFDAVVDSSEVGMRKPDPRIYHHTLEVIGVVAERAVFLDDYPGNVTAAERVGMIGIVVEDDPSDAIARVDALLPPA